MGVLQQVFVFRLDLRRSFVIFPCIPNRLRETGHHITPFSTDITINRLQHVTKQKRSLVRAERNTISVFTFQ